MNDVQNNTQSTIEVVFNLLNIITYQVLIIALVLTCSMALFLLIVYGIIYFVTIFFVA